jgi:hypothetical protein
MSALTVEEISKVLELACTLGKAAIQSGVAPSYSDSIVSEDFLVSLIKEAMIKSEYDPSKVIHHKGHTFPDVSIAGTGVGIELKGTTSNRKFNGNSVVASTMLPNLKKIFLMYWIGSAGDIGCKDYFDCVATPVVTHSPRFQLDIDLDKESSMFGTGVEKVGIIDDIIFSTNGIDSEKIIKWMSDKAKRNGETPWWISNDESLPLGSTGLTKFTNMQADRKAHFLKCAFLIFPKILDKTSSTKYNGLFEWAIQTHSAYTTRDDYSAGGQVQIFLPKFNTSSITVPQSVQGAMDALSNSSKVLADELERPYERTFQNVEDFLSVYKTALIQNLRHIYSEVKGMDTHRIGEDAFAVALADLLISKIDKTSLVFTA